jgi:membrane protein DedA with SNARE-associated domain
MLRRNKVRLYFFIKNFIRGILFFAVAIVFYKVTFSYLDLSGLKEQIPFDLPSTFVFILFFMSEVILGVIPPELFMIWAISSKPLSSYFIYVISFSVISYIAGFVAFLFGKYLHKTWLYEFMRKNIIGKYERKINSYGWLVIVVAAITPLPFSATCAVIGAIGFKRNKYLFYSMARFIRYAIYGFFIWLAHPF